MNPQHCDIWEWEHLRRAITGNVVQIGEQKGNFGVITIARDDKYHISAVIDTDKMPTWADDLPGGVPGTPVVATLVVVHAAGLEIRLQDAMIGSHDYHSNHGLGRGTVHVHVNSFWIGQLHNKIPGLHVDWCLSGPDTAGILTGMTKRDARTGYTRVRSASAGPVHTFATPNDGDLHRGAAWDWLPIRSGERAVRLCQIPKEFGPGWGKCFAIEYDTAGTAPRQDERDGIVEIVGFMFGRQVLPIGTTLFDDTGAWLAAQVRNPWGNLVRSTCEWTDRPAVPMNYGVQQLVVSQLQAMAAAYLLKRDSLDLSTFVWKMFVADMMPRPTGIPVLAPALEGLANKWLKSVGKSKQGHYMDPAAFKDHFAPEFEAMAAKAQGLEHAEVMLKKMQSAYFLSARDLFARFFSDIGLPVGDGEWAVIAHRNALAHGASNKIEPGLSIRVQQAYRTLMTRTLLKILGHTGDYVDYSVAGWPAEHIDKPMGCTDLKELLK